MLKDPTEFRERFLRWKKGELVYENGLALPAYEDGKDANDVPPYTPSIDDREQPGYRKYLWELSKARRNAFLKEYGDAAPIKSYYEDFLSNSEGVFNYRRWYNLASPAERKYGLKKGLAHWADADGKTSLHPSFSIESPYSGYKNPYNPKGITGGKWIDDDHYEFSDSQINNDWPINKTLDEFGRSRKEEGSNTYGYYKGGVMLHEPTIIGKMPKYENGLTPLKKSEVNTNLATYVPEEDLYKSRYTLPEVTVTGDKNKVGTGMGKRLYMHPWKTVGDLSREQHEAEEMAKKSFLGGEQMYDLVTKDLNKPLSPVDPVGEFIVGNAALGPVFKPLEKAGGMLMSAAKNQVSSANIYKGLRSLGMSQKASKELLLSPELAYKRFKNLDMFDKIRGIKYTDNVYHGSRTPFDIDNARTYSANRHDTGLHLGSSETPAYSRANGILGGALYSGKLKLKEEPFEIRDLNTWDIDAIGGEAYNNPAFMQYLKTHGIDVDDLLKKGYELDHEYNSLNALEQEKYLTKHGGMLSDKYLADLFKRHNINLKYKNEFETFSNTPEYSYAIYNPDNVVWNKSFKFSKKPEVLEKLKNLGIAKDYLLPDYHIDLSDLYATLQSFPEFKLPQIRKN